MIRVAIIDDHKLFSNGVMKLLEGSNAIDCTDTFTSFKALQRTNSANSYDVLLLDINLENESGIEVCSALKKNYPDIKIIALTMISEISVIKKMINNGADGYLLKNVDQHELAEAIQRVYQGDIYLASKVKKLIEGFSHKKDSTDKGIHLLPSLSRREKQVLELIIKEYTTQEIADQLKIGFSTVETHRRNIGIKLGARNTAGIVRIALENNLID